MYIFQDPETGHSLSSADKNCVPHPFMKLVSQTEIGPVSQPVIISAAIDDQKSVPLTVIKPEIKAVSSAELKPVLLQDSGDKLTKLQEKGR